MYIPLSDMDFSTAEFRHRHFCVSTQFRQQGFQFLYARKFVAQKGVSTVITILTIAVVIGSFLSDLISLR
jgi:hypothetical protein